VSSAACAISTAFLVCDGGVIRAPSKNQVLVVGSPGIGLKTWP
jgi:hypothetical protein